MVRQIRNNNNCLQPAEVSRRDPVRGNNNHNDDDFDDNNVQHFSSREFFKNHNNFPSVILSTPTDTKRERKII